jgi:hypothetical protein
MGCASPSLHQNQSSFTKSKSKRICANHQEHTILPDQYHLFFLKGSLLTFVATELVRIIRTKAILGSSECVTTFSLTFGSTGCTESEVISSKG